MVDLPLEQAAGNRHGGPAPESGSFQTDRGKNRPEQNPAADPGRSHARPSGARSFAAILSRRLRGIERLHRREQNHHHSLAGAAHPGGDSAFHARAHHGLHGHARSVRKGSQGSVLQRDFARTVLDSAAGGGAYGGLQPRHHHQHRDSRSISRPLRAVSVDADHPLEGPQAAWARPRTPKVGRITASR